MFIAVLCVIAKNWRQHKIPATGEWINEGWYVHRLDHNSEIKRNDISIKYLTNILKNYKGHKIQAEAKNCQKSGEIERHED